MNLFLCLQAGYQYYELALYNAEQCLELMQEKSIKASAHLVPTIDQFLRNHQIALNDLSFFALDQGPGAFTSLRVGLATANALGFAQQLPLIGIDGLDALAHQTLQNLEQSSINSIVVLLNAYNSDVYYGIYAINNYSSHYDPANLKCLQEKSYKNIDVFLNIYSSNYADKKTIFVGNGATMHQETIKNIFRSNALINTTFAQANTNQLAQIACAQWSTQKTDIYKLVPLYLKTQQFVIKK